MKIQDKVVVVTGAGNGMGRELTLLLQKKGAAVAAVDLRAELLQETLNLSSKVGKKISMHVMDITDKNAVAQLVEKVIKEHGTVDVLINNAGIIQPFVRVKDLDFQQIEKVMNVNFYGSLQMIKAFLPLFMNRPEAHIVNISSMGGFLPVPGQSIYGASKAAVKLLSEALYAELLESKVRVSVVFPGAIGTNITKNSGVDIPSISEEQSKSYKTLSPSKAAEKILEGIEKDKLRIYVGSDSNFMNLLCRIAPTFATRFIARQMKGLLN